MNSLRLLPVAICLLLVPAASAAVQLDGQFEATRLQAQDGALQAGLLGFAQEDAAEHGLVPASWHLDAARLRQEADHTDAIIGSTRLTPTTTPPAYYSAATVDGQAVRPGFRFFVLPLDGQPTPMFFAASCMSLGPSDQAQFSRGPMVQKTTTRSNLTADVSNALLWSSCATPTATITGNFRVIFYEVDAELHADGQAIELPSGKHAKAPGPVDTTQAVATADEQFLYAWNATLTVPLGNHPEVYLGAAHVSGGRLQLQDAHGQFVGVQVRAIDAHDLDMAGALAADATGGSIVSAHVTGSAQHVEADGSTLTLATRPAHGAAWWPLAIALVPVAGLLAVAVERARRLHKARILVRACKSLPPTAAEQVIELASRALRLRLDGRAYFLRARARVRLGELGAALEDCEQAWNRLPDNDPDRANVAWQAVAVCHLGGLAIQRQVWMERARRADPPWS